MQANRPLSRRGMLKLTATAIGGLAAVAACGATPTPTPTKVPPTATKPAPTPTAAPKPAEIQFRPQTAYATNSADLWRDAVANVTTKKPHLKITSAGASFSDADEQKLVTAMAAGTGPDVWCHGGSSGGYWGAKKVAEPLDAMVKASPLNGDFYDAETMPHTWNGKLYAIPWRLSPLPVHYRKDIFKEVGLNPDAGPKDWSELATFGQKLAKWDGADIKRIGFGIPASGPHFYFGLFTYAAGGAWFTDDFKKMRINEAPAVEALQFIVDLYHKYKANATYSLATSTAGVPLLVTGQMAMDWANVSSYYFAKKNKPEVFAQWGASVPPTGPKSQGSLIFNDTMLINATSKVKEASWEFIQSLMTYDILEALVPENGGLITLKSWYDKFPEKVKEDMIIGKGLEIMKMAYPVHWGPDWTAVRIALIPFLSEAILQKRTPKDALDAAVSKINSEILSGVS